MPVSYLDMRSSCLLFLTSHSSDGHFHCLGTSSLTTAVHADISNSCAALPECLSENHVGSSLQAFLERTLPHPRPPVCPYSTPRWSQTLGDANATSTTNDSERALVRFQSEAALPDGMEDRCGEPSRQWESRAELFHRKRAYLIDRRYGTKILLRLD